VDPAAAATFRDSLGIATETVRQGVSSGRAHGTVSHWSKWEEFCHDMGLDPFLEAFCDKVPIPQVFLVLVRTGRLATNKDPVRARTSEDYLRSVAQMHLSVGKGDPRANSVGDIDFQIQRMIAAWKKADPPPTRVKPIPVAVLKRICTVARELPLNSFFLEAMADMIIIAFFFLLCPGEYTNSPSDTTPFTLLGDVQLFIGPTRIDLDTASDNQIRMAQSASLTFTTQKNGVPNEVVKLGRSGDPYCCPTLAIIRRVLHLRSNNAPPHTPLARVFLASGTTASVKTADITSILHSAVRFLGFSLGFPAQEVSARSLRAGGAMALLVSKVDTDIIQLLGCWRSDEMLRYLHLTAEPIMRNFAQQMLHADYTLSPPYNSSMWPMGTNSWRPTTAARTESCR
jgi:hypothetical protein